MKATSRTEKSRTLYIVLLLMLAGAYLLCDSYFAVGGFNVGYYYLLAFIIMAVGLVSFLCSPDVLRFKECLRLSGILFLPYFICLIVSMLIYLFHFTEIRQMVSGVFQVVYALIAVLTAGSIFYLLEGKAVSCLFWGVSLAFLGMALLQVREVGVGEFFRQFYILLASSASETLPAMGAMEAPCFAYSYGMLFLYFVCWGTEVTIDDHAVKKRKLPLDFISELVYHFAHRAKPPLLVFLPMCL